MSAPWSAKTITIYASECEDKKEPDVQIGVNVVDLDCFTLILDNTPWGGADTFEICDLPIGMLAQLRDFLNYALKDYPTPK